MPCPGIAIIMHKRHFPVTKPGKILPKGLFFTQNVEVNLNRRTLLIFSEWYGDEVQIGTGRRL